MRRRIYPKATQAPPVHQALIDHKQATLNVIVAQLPERSTFASLGALIGYSHEWVRQRLVNAPERLYKIGKRYQVPRGVAEEFIRSVFV
jgi:hypothetical protein